MLAFPLLRVGVREPEHVLPRRHREHSIRGTRLLLHAHSGAQVWPEHLLTWVLLREWGVGALARGCGVTPPT